MSFTRIVLGWLAVSAWFTVVDLLLGRLRGANASPRRAQPRWLPPVEGLLFTLFAALWFGSLGSGAWVLLFLMLALLIELPHRLRDAVQRSRPAGLAMAVGVGVFRLLVAGGILGFLA